MAEWLILDMDDGVLRREPTRRQAVEWLCGAADGEVLSRYTYGPGEYSYTVGVRGEDGCMSASIERIDIIDRAGWGWALQVPDFYPFRDRPYVTDESIDRPLLLARARGRESVHA